MTREFCSCMVGRHARRARIEQRLAAGESCRQVGHDYGISKDTMRRHWAEHVSEREREQLIRRALAIRPVEALAVAQSDASIEPLQLAAEKNRVLEAAFEKARAAEDWTLALLVDRRQLAWVEFQAKLTNPLRKIDTVNILQNNNFGSDWRDLEHKMLAVARTNPRITLVDFLHQLRQSSQPPLLIEAAAND